MLQRESDSLRGIEVLPVLFRFEVDQGWEQQYHIPPFIHDGRPTVRAADFAGELVFACLLRTVVPPQVMVAVREVDVFLVEDGSPLEGGSCRTT